MLDDRVGTIIDVKTGRAQPWHKVRIMDCRSALPKALPQFKHLRIGRKGVHPTGARCSRYRAQPDPATWAAGSRPDATVNSGKATDITAIIAENAANTAMMRPKRY